MPLFIEFITMFGLAFGGAGFMFNYSHLLNSLLSLEMLALVVYWWLSLVVFSVGSDFFFVLFYLVMLVCESVLGLSLLISGAYSHGSDYMKNYSNLVC